MKRFIPILFLASFSSPAMADIIHQISASTQLQVQAASTHATRIGSTYAVSGNNIELGTTSTTDANGTTVTTSSASSTRTVSTETMVHRSCSMATDDITVVHNWLRH